MACRQKTERIIEVLSSADRRNRLIEWLRSMTDRLITPTRTGHALDLLLRTQEITGIKP